MHDEPRSDLEREALAAWTAQEPPPGFADRVLAADARPKSAPLLEVPELPGLGWRWRRKQRRQGRCCCCCCGGGIGEQLNIVRFECSARWQ